jgi:hypothetical protein
MLPPYLHEKLAVAFDCDLVKVNGVEYQSNDSYSDPSYIDRYVLANSSIKLEQVNWLGAYNSDDIKKKLNEDKIYEIYYDDEYE